MKRYDFNAVRRVRLVPVLFVLAACGNNGATGESLSAEDAGDGATTVVDGGRNDSGTLLDAGALDAALRDAGLDGAIADGGQDAGPARTRRFLCINGAGVDGAGGRESGGNPDFEALCAGLGTNLIRDCASGTCYSSYAFETSGNPSRDALVTALDTDKNGRVTAADAPVDLVLLGYSWGGTNVRDLALWMTTEPRFDDARRGVSLMIALDPYRPGGTMDISANVAKFVEYRHSVAPASDCSRIMLGGILVSGPYLGIKPRCKVGSNCTDYDYSLAPTTFFPGAFTPGRGYVGANVDHCGLVNVSASAITPLLAGTPFSPLPPTVPVATY